MSDLGGMLAWMPAMQQQAAGHTEAALKAYVALLGSMEGGGTRMRDETTAFLVARASEAYASVGDWEGMEAFFTRLEVRTDIHKLPTWIALEAGALLSRYSLWV